MVRGRGAAEQGGINGSPSAPPAPPRGGRAVWCVRTPSGSFPLPGGPPMRVAVIGAGVIGVTTAYELARDGHAVTVVDRRELPASETSYANAGMVAPGHAYAWSSPKALKTLLRALLRDDLALRFRVQAD